MKETYKIPTIDVVLFSDVITASDKSYNNVGSENATVTGDPSLLG